MHIHPTFIRDEPEVAPTEEAGEEMFADILMYLNDKWDLLAP